MNRLEIILCHASRRRYPAGNFSSWFSSHVSSNGFVISNTRCEFDKLSLSRRRHLSGKHTIGSICLSKENKPCPALNWSAKINNITTECCTYCHELDDHESFRSLPMSQANRLSCSRSTRFLNQFNLLKLAGGGKFHLSLRLPSLLSATQMIHFPAQLVTRFMTTMQKSSSSGRSSGTPIDNDKESLLAETRANKRIKINACGQLYSQLAETNPSLYSSAPRDVGIDFQVTYYDSLDTIVTKLGDRAQSAPIICLLHGAPGHYSDYASLIRYLTHQGARVVAPNFPDYSATYEHSFRHSPAERVDFLLNFFSAIKVTKIDMLVGHSSAVYTLFELLRLIHSDRKSIDLKVESIGLFNTPSYDLPPSLAVTPLRLFTLKLFDYPFCRPIIRALIHIFVKVQGIRNKVDTARFENFLMAVSALGYSNNERMIEHLKLVRKCQIPTFVLVGENDKLIPMRCFEQLKRDLGILKDSQVKLYEDGVLKKDTENPDDYVQVSQFDNAGHYAFQRFSQQVNGDVWNFLTKVMERRARSISTKL